MAKGFIICNKLEYMGIFEGLKVVELASVLAGPAAGMFFSELGAEVTKIENKRTNGDVTRNWKLPSEPEDRVSAYFCSVNYAKTSLLLDYSDSHDLSVLNELLASADIVICNFKHGDAQKFNLSYDVLSGVNPSLIYAQLNGFTSIPERVAFDVVLQAESGYMSMNGQSDSPPTKMPLALMDILAAHQLKEGILTALYKREKTGKGSLVETSLEQSAISSLANQATNWLMNHHIPQRIGSLHPNIAPYGEVFKTKDNKLVVLAIGSDKQFNNLCNILNDPSIYHMKIFSSNPRRVENRAELQNILEKLILQFDRDNLVDSCIKQSVPIGAVRNMEEVFENPIAKNMILEEKVGEYDTKRVQTVAFTIQ